MENNINTGHESKRILENALTDIMNKKHYFVPNLADLNAKLWPSSRRHLNTGWYIPYFQLALWTMISPLNRMKTFHSLAANRQQTGNSDTNHVCSSFLSLRDRWIKPAQGCWYFCLFFSVFKLISPCIHNSTQQHIASHYTVLHLPMPKVRLNK